MSANDKTPKTAREAQQQKEARRSNILYATVAILFALLAVAVLVWKSNIIQKSATAATLYYTETTGAETPDGSSSGSVDEADKTKLADVSVPQLSYYFVNIYQNYVRQYGDYISYMGLNTSQPLRDQTYPGDETKTWFDYFLEQAVDQMSAIYALNGAAEEEGYAWNDTMQSEFDDNEASLKASAAAANMSEAKYLRRIYGATMSRGVYEGEMKRVILASNFSQYRSDSLSYTDAELEAEYAADRSAYDVADYQSVKLSGAAATTQDADGNDVEPTEEETAAAMSAAKAAAEKLYADFKAGASLSALAEGGDDKTYTDGNAAPYSSGVLMDWLFDDARKAGDSAVLADESGSAYYVVSFGKRYRQEYKTVDVRHILISPEAGEIAQGEDGYDEEQAKLKADAKAKADDLLAQWKAGAATEDAFAALAKEHSADGGSQANGGLYEQVYQGQMVPTFNDWCFASGRKIGDTGVVETDYGYHIMYYVSENLPFWKVRVDSTLRNRDFGAWYESVTAGYGGDAADGAKYVG